MNQPSIFANVLRSVPATIALISIIVVIYLAQVLSGVHWLEPVTSDIIAWGGNLAVYTLTGDSWRLFTSMFLHAGLIHLVMNVYMLMALGPLVERQFGTAHFLMIYLATGLVGSLASALWLGSHTIVPTSDIYRSIFKQAETIQFIVSVGASGALMGLAGACLFGRLLGNYQTIDNENNQQINKAIAQVILINVCLGFFVKGIDQAAHLGGLASGALLGALCVRPWRFIPVTKEYVRAIVLGLLVTAVVFSSVSMGKSEELVELRSQLMAEKKAAADAKVQADVIAAANEAAKKDEMNAPPPVSREESAGKLVKAGSYPSDFVLSADEKHLYVTSNGDNRLTVLDATTGTILKTIDGGAFPKDKHSGCSHNFCRGIGAAGVAVRRDEKFAYVSSMKEDAIVKVDLTSNTFVDSVPVGRFPRNILLSPDETKAYVFSVVDQAVWVIDLATFKPVGTPLVLSQPLSDRPYGGPAAMWLSADGKHVWAYAGPMEQLDGFDTSTAKSLDPVVLDGFDTPTLSRDGQQLLVMGWKGLQVRDAASLANIRDYPFCQYRYRPRALAISPDGSYLAMSQGESGVVRMVKLATRRTVGLYSLAGDPKKLQFSRDGKLLYALISDEQGGIVFMNPDKSLDVKQTMAEQADVLCFPDPTRQNN
jgi:rhomboid protease GluP